MANIDVRIEKWKKRLLDLGKRNRLVNYRETKRSNIKITAPNLADIYTKLVVNEKALTFSSSSQYNFDETESSGSEYVIKGDLETNRSIKEQQITLANLRSKTKIAAEEQGVNILYLSVGFLHWKESIDSDQILVSPIVLVPVTLTRESITSPFVLSLHEDEIVVNPTLSHKLENDFNISFPNFDSNENDIESFLYSIREIVLRNRWNVTFDLGLSMLSFLKINMYRDLEKNKDRISSNIILRALSGDKNEIMHMPDGYDNFDHDGKTRPIDTYQVLDADSSQQDAILFSKKGASFILQGPPGTGKSQTIANIISEGLADGKKILFVSEKMAALEVVHKRLSQVGLANFCLPLHSHKANKKEILNQLSKTINLNKFNLQDDILHQLESLKSTRDSLNQYMTELHTPCPPLGNSIYEINGKVAKLQTTPDIIFHLDEVRATTPEKLSKYKYLLETFAGTIGKMSEDYETNPWRDSQVLNITHELRHDIETNLKHLLPNLKTLSNHVNKSVNELGLGTDVSIKYIFELIKILEVASKSPRVPVSWILEEDIAHLSRRAEKYKLYKMQYEKLEMELSSKFTDGFFSLEANKIYSNIITLLNLAKKTLSRSAYPSDSAIANSVNSIVASLHTYLIGINSLQDISKKLLDLFGGKPVKNINNAIEVTNFIEHLLANPKPTKGWFETEKLKIVKRLFLETKNKCAEIETAENNILAEYVTETLNLDFLPMMKRFKVEYSSIFKIFNKNYWADKKHIKSLLKDSNKKIDDLTILVLLMELMGRAENKSWLSKNDEIITTLLGGYYLNEFTGWAECEKGITNFEKILEYFAPNSIPEKVKNILLSEEVKTSEFDLYIELKTLWNTNLHTAVHQTFNIEIDTNNNNFDDLMSKLGSTLSILNDLSTEYKKIISFCIQETNYSDVIENLSKLDLHQKIKKNLELENENLQNEFQFLFQGMKTNWEEILNSLIWTSDFKKLNQQYKLPRSFIENICLDEPSINHSAIVLVETRQALKAIQNDWIWFLSLFSDNNLLNNTELLNILTRVEKCFKNLSALEEWIDFRNSREQCKLNGLSDFIEKLDNSKLDSNLILPAFLKRFYRLWLDAIIPQFPAVELFRRRTQEHTIKRFIQLDKDQLAIAQTRVKHQLVSRLPDFNNRFTTAFDEVGTLKRELNKQRKIMPLRKLFKAIPNLLLTLKPCLMMSPLSVSLFLEADDYKFDLVLFDEASQVRTEDAIGAIMRGSQVIITGDSKQLPPTNFFAANTSSDNEFDTDDNEETYDDTDSYQSILDEAVTVLPERTLRWHYRSRHEHLIAFSNAKVYNNSLITFPSYIERIPDNGVEYIYVANGIYDRSGKRNNILEAKKVAEIVFEHIRNYPRRSLGVVTFSEAQQQTVETAINQLRLLHQQYESFFAEDKEDSFFVKNLENVQGDERDTIIFSIGYAKDQNGMMYMNFGPLSKEGGYRRLNVAITRAKYNVKLVGSIHPTDINIENTSAEGVKMLRSYIEFAINGADVLSRELIVPDVIAVESPFEESVYDFLVKNGYKVTTQVGCSGYRIDMAIKHPTLNGIFVLGIECDGATYHSARTARERDRLRQTILEDIGWKIYRIWSTDWIKDPITEGQKLIEAVMDSISTYAGNHLDIISAPNNVFTLVSDEKFLTIEVPIDPKILAINPLNPFGFPIYKEADIPQLTYSKPYTSPSEAIYYVIELEYPIHFELLCKRVASIFGNQKATNKVQNAVRISIIRNLNNKVLRKGDFYWLIDSKQCPVRIPAGDESDRKIEYISTEELTEAMFIIAGTSVGILPTDLFLATARLFGFGRSGSNITQSMQTACEYLLETGRAKNISGKIIVQ